MRTLTPSVCLIIVAASSAGCVAATRASEPGDSAAANDGGAPDRMLAVDASPDRSVEATVPESGSDVGRTEASSRDAAADHAEAGEAGKADSAADAAHASDAGDGAPVMDATPSCAVGETLCGTACVDTQTDPDHCGDCTTVCPSAADGSPACGAGSCGVVCNSGYHNCSGACDDDTSVDSCGSSCTPCTAPINAIATCDGTSCGFTCSPGTVSCNGAAACCTSTVLTGGGVYTCLLSGSDVECVGADSLGQLGDGALTTSFTASVFELGALSPISAVAGNAHTCALTNMGALYCAGDNSYGDLGNGGSTKSDTPVAVTGLGSGVIAVAAGADHTCALLVGGSMECWGYNDAGQLGLGSTTNESTPQPVTGLSGVTALAAGAYHTCAVLGGAAWCWGMNAYGELGTGSTTVEYTPVTVSTATGLSNVVAVAAASEHTCALTSSGTVWCWGDNTYGELGNGTTTSSDTPVEIIPTANFGGSLVVAISAQSVGEHTCAINASGTVWCWGENSSGQLGNGTTTNSPTPVEVTGLTGAIRIATGAGFSCAQVSGGDVYCWGSGSFGQLGNDSNSSSTTPVAASSL
jgi:alpha-tubulin suppressor-like RCC1 family protein